MWKGKIGIFTAKAKVKSRNKIFCCWTESTNIPTVLKSKPSLPNCWPTNSPTITVPANKKMEPNTVYRMNLIVAYFLFFPPHIPIRKYIGINIASKKRKNDNKSPLVKTPTTADSITKIEIKKPFVSLRADEEERIAKGTKIAVKRIIIIETPLTLNTQSIP